MTHVFANESNMSAGKKVVTFYGSYGYSSGEGWHLSLPFWVAKSPDTIRQLTGKGARRLLQSKAGIAELSDAEKKIFEKHVEGFIADSESRERVSIVFDNDPQNTLYKLAADDGEPKTDRNGNLDAKLTLSQERAEELLTAQNSTEGWLRFHAVSNGHWGSGQIRLISRSGISVISDIDDTIKDTGITLGHETVLVNTFFRQFRQVPCMSLYYNALGADTVFHYVSGAPWQLYTPLADFLFQFEDRFPLGSMHMKNVRTNLTESESYQDIGKLLKDGSQQTTYHQKIQQISTILEHFPERQFVLVGDSGERDPEVFSDIRERFRQQVNRIVIRDVNHSSEQHPERLEGMSIISNDEDQQIVCDQFPPIESP